jgi:hypothetical protein
MALAKKLKVHFLKRSKNKLMYRIKVLFCQIRESQSRKIWNGEDTLKRMYSSSERRDIICS